jgi:hypothetical protein
MRNYFGKLRARKVTRFVPLMHAAGISKVYYVINAVLCPMSIPDRIFAVGGAGKTIAFEFLSTEWVLEQILSPSDDPQELRVTIMDSAEEEKNDDRRKVDDIREKIGETKEELRDVDKGRPGDISLEYKLINENIQLNSQIDLLGDEEVSRIASGNGMDKTNWWLGEDHINENLDFAKGVVRKRGLGKGIYYKAYSEDDEMSSIVDLPQKGEVAIVAGLGGGTGSGILVDLAYHLKEQHPTSEITLFGVLPNHTEGIKESTNAHAVLSELERLSLEGNSPFEDYVLVPIDPTGFDGKKGNKISTEQPLLEYDRAFVYLLSSYYNTQDLEDPFTETPSYAPFTVAIPQVLRYNVESIKHARTALTDMLNKKQESLEAEEELYTGIERFLSQQFDSAADGELTKKDETDLEDRVKVIESLIEIDLFNELDYESLSVYKTEVLNPSERESESVEQQIDMMRGSVEAGVIDQIENQMVDRDVDQFLAEVLEKDTRMIAKRKELMKRKEHIDESQIRDTIEYLMASKEGSAGAKFNQLETKIEDKEGKRERIEEELDSIEREIEDVREEQDSEIQRSVNEWEQRVEADLDRIQTLADQPIRSHLSELERELEKFRDKMKDSDSLEEANGISDSNVQDVVDDLGSELSEVGIEFDRGRVLDSVRSLKQARKAWFGTKKSQSGIKKYIPGTSSVEEEKEEAYKKYRMEKSKLNDRGIFSLAPPEMDFKAEINDNIIRNIEEKHRRKKTELRDRVVEELREMLDDSASAHQFLQELESEIEGMEGDVNRNTIQKTVREAFEQDIINSDKIQDLERRREELESDLKEIEKQEDIYSGTLDLLEKLNPVYTEFSDNRSEFNRRKSDYDEGEELTMSSKPDDYVYVKNIQPGKIFRATKHESLKESELFINNPEETQRLRGNLEELVKNTLNQKYNTLQRRKLKIGEDNLRYEDMKVRFAVMSPVIDDIGSDVMDFEDMFGDAFDLGGGGTKKENRYTAWKRNIGGDWDIGVSVFITGVFLDNIRKFVQSDGYRYGYSERQERLGDDILIHHSYGLDKGFFVRRAEEINVESEDDIGFYLQANEDIPERLVNDYFEKVEVSAAKEEEDISKKDEETTVTGKPEEDPKRVDGAEEIDQDVDSPEGTD